MRRAVLLMGALALACTEKKAPAPAPKTAPAKAEAPKLPARLYVTASTLRMRRGPSTKASTRGRLAINSPLVPLATEGDFTQVRVENGKQGWVASAYLSPTPVTAEAALAAAEAAEDPKARLSWLQRAAAVASTDRAVLTKLREAYAAAGEDDAVKSVERLIDRLSTPIRLNARLDGEVARIEWQMLEPFRTDGPNGAVERGDWGSYGLPADATFWVLPSHGPAVRGRATKAEIETVNECGGTSALVVQIAPEADLGGAFPVAVAVGERPEGWDVDAPAPPKADVEGAIAEAKALVQAKREPYLAKDRADARKPPNEEEAAFFTKNGLQETVGVETAHALAVADGVLVYVAEAIATDYDAVLQSYRVWKVKVDARGAATLLEPPVRSDGFLDAPKAARDVDGDGRTDLILDDHCATSLQSASGEVVLQTGFRCCGC